MFRPGPAMLAPRPPTMTSVGFIITWRRSLSTCTPRTPMPSTVPQVRKVMVAFRCDHPFEDRCNPRYCGSGHPYLAVIERTDEHVARGWAAPGAQRRQFKVEALGQ